MDTIEFVQDVILHEINKNDVELKSSENGVKYCKIEIIQKREEYPRASFIKREKT